MKLSDLLDPDIALDDRFRAIEVSDIGADSRRVKPGVAFVAIPGTHADGLRFVPQAIASGARVILAEKKPSEPLPDNVAFVQVPDARRALARAAARFHPRQPETIAAVTGTSGKTSVAAFTRQIWEHLKHQAASIGTIGIVSPRGEIYGSLTTPDPIQLHRTLDRLAAEGVTHLALEASSHGLDQRRLDGVRVAAGAFTNITRDHLDYHGNLDAYLAAKLTLLTRLVPEHGAAVINVDHPFADRFLVAARARGQKIISVGRKARGIRLVAADIEGFAQSLQIEHEDRVYRLRLPLVGAFQVENALVAAGLAIATGSPAEPVFEALEHLRGAKGRLEHAGAKNGAPIFIDYAHKPDALAKTLEALRPFVTKRLIVVFGAGGDRDVGKRPIMGAIAQEKADRVIVTDDNPRSEDPAAIRAQILSAAPKATEIGDRLAAIHAAIAGLSDGDVLLIAGKGHESGQIVGDRVLPFSDHAAVAAALGDTR